MRYLLFLTLLLGAGAVTAQSQAVLDATAAPVPMATADLLWVSDPVPDPDAPPAIVELAIPAGGARMSGLLYQANGPGPHPTVLLLHGLPGNEKNLDLAQLLRRAGFNVLFFHYRGAWGSEGDYSLLQLDDDVLSVLGYLRQGDRAQELRTDLGRISLLGHSLGGFAALAAGARDDELICVGAIAPANLAVIRAGLTVDDPASMAFLAYADSLFMLRGFDGEAMRRQLFEGSRHGIDTRSFSAGLVGKSVFMVVGDQDQATPPALMFDPVVKAYQREQGLRLQAHTISGDHSFSWSRTDLARRVLDWMQADCR